MAYKLYAEELPEQTQNEFANSAGMSGRDKALDLANRHPKIARLGAIVLIAVPLIAVVATPANEQDPNLTADPSQRITTTVQETYNTIKGIVSNK